MKKILFSLLAIAVVTTGFAQKVTLKKGDIAKQSVITKISDPNQEPLPGLSFEKGDAVPRAQYNTNEYEEHLTMTTNYDKQTNGCYSNRIALWGDGTVAVVNTWDHSNMTSWPDRGAGYNYYDGSSFGEEPTQRVEPMKSGWPTICASGNAEVMASHATGVNVYRRENKGEGEWQLITNFPDLTWPKICASGNGQYIHLVADMNYADENNNTIYDTYYARSTDGGLTWSDPVILPELELDLYHHQIGADDYALASNGNTIAILFGGISYEMFYLISHDNGETWEKQVVAEFPYGHSLDWYQTEIDENTDTIWSMDNSQSIAIDNRGTVHVAFGLTRWTPAPSSGFGYLSYWPYTDAIVYWNSEYVNEEGTHCIPRFGKSSVDSADPFWLLNGTDGVSNTLNDERLERLAELDGNEHLHLFGWPDQNGDSVVDYTEYWSGHIAYTNYGIANSPGISIDQNGNMAIIYSVLSENRVNSDQGFYYRDAYVTCRDNSGIWFDDAINLTEEFVHLYDEAYPTTACPYAKDGSFWFGYSADEFIGLFIDRSEDHPEYNNGTTTDNFFYAVKVTPDMEFWGIDDNEAVNPMTSMRVYPNPVQDQLNVEINASQASLANIAVYNITGQKVMEQNVNISTGINRPAINTTSLTSGIYFVTVKANGFENTQKFIVK